MTDTSDETASAHAGEEEDLQRRRKQLELLKAEMETYVHICNDPKLDERGRALFKENLLCLRANERMEMDRQRRLAAKEWIEIENQNRARERKHAEEMLELEQQKRRVCEGQTTQSETSAPEIHATNDSAAADVRPRADLQNFRKWFLRFLRGRGPLDKPTITSHYKRLYYILKRHRPDIQLIRTSGGLLFRTADLVEIEQIASSSIRGGV